MLYFFTYNGEPQQKLQHRFSGSIKWGDNHDIPGILECTNISKKSLYMQRLQNGEKCLVATDKNGITAGYGWLTLRNTHIEDKTHCVFNFPEGAIYAYDFYIMPQYRLTGIWVGFINLILNSEYYIPDIGLYCSIDYGNHKSLRFHIRFGFKIYQQKTILNIFNYPISFTKNLEHTEMTIKKILGT